MERLSRARFALVLGLGGVALVISTLVALAMGPVSIGPDELLAAFGGPGPDAKQALHHEILIQLRAPRVLLGLLVGGALAAVGATLQSVMRNELADPYILGISSGAAIGAALAAVAGLLIGPWAAMTTTSLAFITATLSVLAVYAVARVDGRLPAMRLLLAGVAWSSFATALSGFLLFLAPEAEQVRGVFFWLMGGFANSDWSAVFWVAPIVIIGLLYLFVTARWQNLLLLGDEPALALGLDVKRTRGLLVLACSLITATTVATAGAIGFVGLIVPHALRPLVGPDHRRLLPSSVLAGAILMVWMDGFARTILAPRELPVGLLTGLLGAPFFLLLLRRMNRPV